MEQIFLEKAILIATKAHMGQVDKAGKSYILHPLRVMQKVASIDAKIVAILHDVVEDTEITLEDLRKEGFSREILEALGLLTHIKGVPYMDYVVEVKKNSLAREVKIADLYDNLDLDRLSVLTEKDLKRIKKYKDALYFLKN